MKDFEFWKPWEDSTVVKGTFKSGTGEAHADVADWLNIYTFINGMGLIFDGR